MSKFLVSLFLLFICNPPIWGNDFPALMQWTNSLDSEEKIKDFTESSAEIAREVVTVHKDADQNNLVYLGTKATYQLSFGLNRLIKSNRSTRQVMLIFNHPKDYTAAYNTLTLFQHDWILYHFPIEMGPNNDNEPVELSAINEQKFHEDLRRHPLSFGFTTDVNFGAGEYLRPKMDSLANLTDEWYTKLKYTGQFMVEFSMHILMNTSDHARIVRPFVDRTMAVTFATTDKHEAMIVAKRGNMKAIGRMFGKKRVYLNVPESLRHQLNPTSWFGSTSAAIWTQSWQFRIHIAVGGVILMWSK